jgi:EAL domain-containing protein (putative c-di-GMP-specific phosphodiesterase class I)
MSFVNGLGRGAGESAMATAIVQLAQNLGIETLAEGVERPEQVSALRAIRCGYAQGFHFSPPVSADAFEAMLLEESANALPPPRRIASR